MRATRIVMLLALTACRDHERPTAAPVHVPSDTATIALAAGVITPHPIDPDERERAAIRVAMQWLESVRYGAPANDTVFQLPLVSVVPPCEGGAACARERIEKLMSIDPKLLPNIVASDLIAHFYHSRAFDTLGAATHVNVSVFGDLGRLGLERADITFAVMPGADGTLAIRGIEVATH
jgi:hypothetical protein